MKINHIKRKRLESELQKGTELTKIADSMGITRHAIYLELKRSGMTRDNYDADKAQSLAVQRLKNQGRRQNESLNHYSCT